MDRYVLDAGPLIHLDQINHLKILQKLHSIIIPASVIQEIRHDTAQNEIKTIIRWSNVKIVPTKTQTSASIRSVLKKYILHKGEIDCLECAIEMGHCIFLTDDLNARRAAEKLNIEVHGTVGIIAYAVHKKWLTVENAEDALNLLFHQSSLFVTYSIIKNAINTIKNFRP